MPRTPITSIWSNFGINVGNNIHNGDTYNALTVAGDVQYHKSLGIKHVRGASMGYFWTRVQTGSGLAYGLAQDAALKSMFLQYLAAGMTVQFICEIGTYDKNDAALQNGYRDYLADEAAWAQANGITRFQIDNELELRMAPGTTHADVYDWLQTLPAVVRSAGFTGTITASVVPDNWWVWGSNGIGNFDDVGIDVYGTMSSFVSTAQSFASQLGPNTYLSEWSTDSSLYDLYLRDPGVVRDDIIARYKYIQQKFPGHVNYLHVWKNANDNGQDGYSACALTGEQRLFWFPLTGQRCPIAS